jgi:hypothetical protein
MEAVVDGYRLIDSTENYPFWTDGEKVYFLEQEVKRADLDSFIVYPGDNEWAKDKNTVYCRSGPWRKADKDTFEALNYSFVKDKLNVWTLNGKIDGVDIKTFEVCDSGKIHLRDSTINGKLFKIIIEVGYGKDKNNVYYNEIYDKVYKPKTLNGAIPETFVSLDNGYFGYDENSVYFENKKIKKANPKTWKLFKKGCLYSKDKHIYYKDIIMKEADIETFEIINDTFAKDKNNYYNCVNIWSKEKNMKIG